MLPISCSSINRSQIAVVVATVTISATLFAIGAYLAASQVVSPTIAYSVGGIGCITFLGGFIVFAVLSCKKKRVTLPTEGSSAPVKPQEIKKVPPPPRTREPEDIEAVSPPPRTPDPKGIETASLPSKIPKQKIPDLKSPFSERLWLFSMMQTDTRLIPVERDQFKTFHEAATSFLARIEAIENELIKVLPKDDPITERFSIMVNGGTTRRDILTSFDGEGRRITTNMEISVAGLKKNYSSFLNNHNAYARKEFLEETQPKEKVVGYDKRVQQSFGDRLYVWYHATDQLPDLTGNVYRYPQEFEAFVNDLRLKMYQVEKDQGVAGRFQDSFNLFFNYMQNGEGQSKSAKMFLDLAESMRNYLAIRELPDIRGSNTGVCRNVVERLKAVSFLSSPYLKLQKVERVEDGYLRGYHNGKAYLILGYDRMPSGGHFNNVFFNPRTKEFLAFDTLSPNQKRVVKVEASDKECICIPWQTFEMHRERIENIDISNWAIPRNQNNNCFFVSALLSFALHRFWKEQINKF